MTKSAHTPSVPRGRGPLSPVEMATAGILSGLTVVLGILSVIVPFPLINALFQMLAAVPIAMVAVRLRTRAGVTAFMVTVLVGLMLGGMSTAFALAQSALAGLAVGILLRKGIGRAGAAAVGFTLGAIIGAAADLALYLLADLRDLFLESARVSSTGYLKLIGRVDSLKPFADQAIDLVEAFLRWWWVWVPASAIFASTITVVLAHWVLKIVLSRLQLAANWDPLIGALDGAEAVAPNPLPTTLRGVTFSYPGASEPALSGVDLDIRAGEFVVVVGANGSGKSTLSLVLAGATPQSGTVTRPGCVGLGRRGGVALLAQRSELQMLGETVYEDVAWGMTPEELADVDIDALLDVVGLAGLGEAITRHLSGGQLQRLALAGVLATRPALLISDESTAMIDQAGRNDLVRILSSLPPLGTAVVHVTHDTEEAARADRLVRIDAGRVVFDGAPSQALDAEDAAVAALSPAAVEAEPGPAATPALVNDDPEPPPRYGVRSPQARAQANAALAEARRDWTPSTESLWVDRVTHAYDVGTPWENRVLSEVSLVVAPGEATLISGGNGSGKTTLSRILTGLMAPTWGQCTLGGRPMIYRVGDVALSMQLARLQLQRPSVRSDILAAAHARSSMSTREADRIVHSAMDLVGLPTELEHRGIDQLSGGQMRRVALAGLLASEPSVLVLDEPLAGLDAESRSLLVDVLERRRSQGLAVLVISHDTDGLDALIQRSLTLNEGVLS